jgi:hypothetical protein
MLRLFGKRKAFARLVVVACLLAVAIGLLPAFVSAQQGIVFNTLRIYGRLSFGAGDNVLDPITAHTVEDRPYTDAEAIFMPQKPQAPIKDSVTWNPVWMYENQTFDENQAKGLYDGIFAGGLNASEKVWLRTWYEPDHWDKDLNANGVADVTDEHYPAIMQEYTYLLMEPQAAEDNPEPYWGQAGTTSFVFPVGMRAADLFTAQGDIDTSSANARYGYGLTSLDGNFDGIPDIVHVESELTLFAQTQIAADLNGSGAIDPLDRDTTRLNGNELVVMRLDPLPVARGGYIQFTWSACAMFSITACCWTSGTLATLSPVVSTARSRSTRVIWRWLAPMALRSSSPPSAMAEREPTSATSRPAPGSSGSIA